MKNMHDTALVKSTTGRLTVDLFLPFGFSGLNLPVRQLRVNTNVAMDPMSWTNIMDTVGGTCL